MGNILDEIGDIGEDAWDYASDFIPGIGDAKAQEKANVQNLELDKKNREWMERMSNTAYQRAMTDMRKAGLNPAIAYQQGGASVPSSSAATVGAATKTGLGDAALKAYTGISAAQTQRQAQNTAQAQSESSIALQGAQSAQVVADTAKAQAETEKVKESIKSERVRRQLDQSKIPLETVKSSAAELSKKGMSTLNSAFDKLLKNVAKPNPGVKPYSKIKMMKINKE